MYEVATAAPSSRPNATGLPGGSLRLALPASLPPSRQNPTGLPGGLLGSRAITRAPPPPISERTLQFWRTPVRGGRPAGSGEREPPPGKPVASGGVPDDRSGARAPQRGPQFPHARQPFGKGGKRDRRLLPERPSGCFAQKVPVPSSAGSQLPAGRLRSCRWRSRWYSVRRSAMDSSTWMTARACTRTRGSPTA